MKSVGIPFYMRPGDPLRWLIGGWKIPNDEVRVHMRTILIKDNWMVKNDGSMVKATFVDPKKQNMDDALYVVEARGRYRWLHKATEEMDMWPDWVKTLGTRNQYDMFEWQMASEDIDMIAVYLNHLLAISNEKYPFIHPQLIKTAFTPSWYPTEIWLPKIDPLFDPKKFHAPYVLVGRQPLRLVILMPMRHTLKEEMHSFKEVDTVEDLLFGDGDRGRISLIPES